MFRRLAIWYLTRNTNVRSIAVNAAYKFWDGTQRLEHYIEVAIRETLEGRA